MFATQCASAHGIFELRILIFDFRKANQSSKIKNGGLIMAASNNKHLVNTIELGRNIKRRREELNLSLRDVANETGISASTLSRIENGTGKPDADNIARISQWLNMPMERVMNTKYEGTVEPVVYYPHEATPSIVEAHLRADKNLTPETAKALSELFRVAYAQFSVPGTEPSRRRR
jgi:transcriptional regulator with XRE-family HTH domain